MADKQHKTTVNETENVMTEETELVEGEVQSGKALIKWEPENIELIYGVTVDPGWSEEDFQNALFTVAPYTKVKTTKVDDDIIGHRMTVAGAATHDVEVTAPAGLVDVNTGALLETVTRPRTIFKIVAIDGERLRKPMMLSFVSVSIFNEMKRLYYKRYGLLDWAVEVDMIFSRQPAKVGNVYIITPVRKQVNAPQ